MSNSPIQHLDLPLNLPVPVDDGACDHLVGTSLPPIILPSTAAGAPVDVSSLSGLTIVFCYPRTGEPGIPVPIEWNLIPGARGCTPQACAFRDTSAELRGLGVQHIFGLSTQDTPYQTEAKERLHLPFEILSDAELKWVKGLNLPTFEWQGKMLVRRITMAVQDGMIIKKWYPIFPSDRNAYEVVEWLKGRQNSK
ncbi:hypothetical protein H2248_002415 [Termitomyces sp. 'cryptogamus']|nr:hypothetical protein H2248_002415 [Termitomyces sp. 'cryptogamus']